MDKIAELVARRDIEDCLLRYARGVDRRDWDMVKDSFHPDCTDSHGPFEGKPDGFIAWVTDRHADVPFCMHFLGNCLIDYMDDAAAAVETYFIAIQRRVGDGPDGGDTDHEVFGRYCDLFEDRGTGWRIARREVVYDSTRQQPSTNHLRAPVGVQGRRDGDDPIFKLLASRKRAVETA